MEPFEAPWDIESFEKLRVMEPFEALWGIEKFKAL